MKHPLPINPHDEAALAAAGTLSLFEQWAAADATGDSEELLRRTQEAEVFLRELEASPLRLREPSPLPTDHD